MSGKVKFEDYVENYRSKRHFRRTIHTDRARRFVYMKNHKSGCTSILGSIFAQSAQEKGQNFQPAAIDDIHRNHHGLLLPVSRLSEGDILALLSDPRVFKFTYIREPVARVASAFEDKIASGGKLRTKFLNHIGYDEDFPIAFEEFVHVLKESPETLNLDPHWRPQVKEISYGLVPYDHIGLLENLDEELPLILQRIFGASDDQPFDARKALKHKTRAKRLARKLAPAERKILEQLYAEDLELYRSLENQKLKAETLEILAS